MIVAIIEDCDITRFLHATLIKDLDLTINLQQYSSGEDFLKDLKSDQIDMPDIVLTDYNMGQLNGVDVINELASFCSAHQITHKLRSYLVSANVDVKSILDDCDKDFCQGFIPKPLNSKRLKDIISPKHGEYCLRTA